MQKHLKPNLLSELQERKEQRMVAKNQIKRKFQAIKPCFRGQEVRETSHCELV